MIDPNKIMPYIGSNVGALRRLSGLLGWRMSLGKDKRGDFRRLAELRTRAALDIIRKLENLSNRTNYEYTDQEVERIFSTLETALATAKAKFSRLGTKSREFRL